MEAPAASPRCIFSIDVEDWFHLLELPTTPDVAQWDALPSRVEASFRRLLDVLAERGARATCFFLGWVAERFPALVREAAARGHEVASHGHAHVPTYRLARAAFLADVRRAKAALEDAAGVAVRGYRAPGFSVTPATPWAFDALRAAGYTYDSSVFPAPRAHGGGLAGATLAPHVIATDHGPLVEVPATVTHVLGRPVCVFGGGYLRLAPYALTRRLSARVLREGRPVVFYLHPREVDPGHPRLPMGPARRFKSYANLATTERKVRRLLADFRVTTFAQYLADHPPPGATLP